MRLRQSSLFGCALAACLVALAAPALADEPTPPSYYDPTAYPPPWTRWALIGAGLGSTAVWYGGALGFSYLFPDAPGANDLRTPIIGPFLALRETGCASDEPDCSIFIPVLRAILTTMDGIGQVGGLAVALEGVFLPTIEPAAEPTRPRRLRLERTESSLHVAPIVTHNGGLGLGLSGTF